MPNLDWKTKPGTAIAMVIAGGLKEALQKHLYQSVTVDTKSFPAAARETAEIAWRGSKENLAESEVLEYLESFAGKTWYPVGTAQLPNTSADGLRKGEEAPTSFKLPTLKLACPRPACQEIGPFNPVGVYFEVSASDPSEQWFYLSYQCQNCKGEASRFLVKRDQLKLRLCGCEPIRSVELPAEVPKIYGKHLRNALVARQAGQTLAGIFQMRVFVEQFWKLVPEVQAVVSMKRKATGDEMGEAYKQTLPLDFRSRFPTLCEVYEALSVAIHSADENEAAFDDNLALIARHFDARRLFELVNPKPAAAPVKNAKPLPSA